MRLIYKTFFGVLLDGLVVCAAPVAMADTQVNYHGTLVHEPPCKFTDEAPLEVNFGDIQIADVDGVNHRNGILVPASCNTANAEIYVRHLGTAVSFDTAAVQTNIPDFGIRLLYFRDATALIPFPVGELVKIHFGNTGTSTKFVSFYAMPVKKDGATLATGAFSGASTLQIEVP